MPTTQEPRSQHQQWQLLARLSKDVTVMAERASRSLPPGELAQFGQHLRWLSDMLHVETADAAHPQ